MSGSPLDRSERRAGVVYIAGFGRSGSTLLAYLLGQLPPLYAAGELKLVWERGLKNNERCACGARFLACPFWVAVGERAFGGWDALAADDVLSLRRRVVRARSLPFLVAPSVVARPRAFVEYAELVTRLYAAIADVSGCDYVVDSSKTPLDAIAIARMPGVQARVVHLVRDSRGVAYSWAKRGIRNPAVVETADYMPSYGAFHTAARWTPYNAFLHLLTRLRIPSTFARYEPLVASPRAEIARISRDLRIPIGDGELGTLDDPYVDTTSVHNISGNPMRFRTSRQHVRTDEQWKSQMQPRERAVVVALTWPLLLRYGYLDRKRGGGGAGRAGRGRANEIERAS